jgi:hypothetical protein
MITFLGLTQLTSEPSSQLHPRIIRVTIILPTLSANNNGGKDVLQMAECSFLQGKRLCKVNHLSVLHPATSVGIASLGKVGYVRFWSRIRYMSNQPRHPDLSSTQQRPRCV